MKYEDDVPELGEFKLPYPKNPPLVIDTNGIELLKLREWMEVENLHK